MAALVLGLTDMTAGILMGGDMSLIPDNSEGFLNLLADNPIKGLYFLDFLNMVSQALTMPLFLSLVLLHRDKNPGLSLTLVVLSVTGLVLFIAGNAALPLWGLARKFAVAGIDKPGLLAAGEALLARGEHGSPGAFPAFFISTMASLSASFLMFRGGLFGKPVPSMGIAGSLLLLVYLVLVTFVPGTKTVAMALAAPGGLSALIWLAGTAVIMLKKRAI
jgi:hypothetical protein